MLRKLVLAVAALILVPLGAAALLRATGTGLPLFGAPSLPPAFAQTAEAADTLALAEMALTRCKLLRNKNKRDCYEEILLALVEQGRTRLAIGVLALVGEQDREVRRIGHDYSHLIGINSWRAGMPVGEAYEQCTEIYQSGCYHGVIQVYLTARGISDSTVPQLCNSVPAARESLFLRFQCVHGLGHGMVMLNQAHLPKALSGCDLLPSDWDRDSCYGGAFMEFILTGRGQSHTGHAQDAAAAQGAVRLTEESHNQHDHGDHPEASTADSFPIRKSGDLLYPCNALDDKYRRACYAMQAGIMVETTGLDFAKIAAGCDLAEERYRPTCYQGIGTYVSGATVREPAQAIVECSKGRIEYQPWCFIGVVKNFIDVTAKPEDGLSFCAKVGIEGNRVACYVAVGEQLSVLQGNTLERDKFCQQVSPEAREACRFGAGLTDDPPRGLPNPGWFRRPVD